MRLAKHPYCLPLALFALGTGACTDAVVESAGAVTRSDSAGVEIVVLASTPEAVPILGTLEVDGALRVGSPVGRTEEQFGVVRDVVGLSDGGIAVLDGQAAEVRLFGRDGEHQRTLGRRGDGPGEFREPVELALLPGDTLAIYDRVPGRVTRFSIDGATTRVTTLQDTETQVSEARLLSDGRLVGQSHFRGMGNAVPNGEPTLVRNIVVLTLFDERGQVVETIDTVPSAEEIVSIQLSAGALSVLKRPPIFPRDNLFASGPAATWSSENDRFELRLRETASGRLLRIVRAPSLERAATTQLAEEIHSRLQDEAETAQERAQLETWFAISPRPEYQPAFDAFVTDDRERLWVRAWSAFGDATRWWVFEADGALLGAVDAPAGMRITSVTCSSVLGIERGEFDVDYAVRYPLDRVVPC